ncbi:MAG: helix-turn-helix transcriptional regulator [Clostridia bacterium]|nr:helix-turn-helix transcriptional regulator [Clostridia bacterium]
MEQSTLERRFRRNGVEMPFHCITIHAKQNKVSAETWGFHYHDYIEILYSLASDCDVYINDKIIPFKTGDLIIVNSGESHALTFERADAHYIVIKVLPEILYSNDKSLFELKYMMPFIIQDSNNKRYFSSEEIGGRYIKDVMSDIMNEWYAENYGYEIAIRSNILKIFLWILRFWQASNLDSLDKFDYSDENLKIIQSATEYISQNYSDVTALEVAEHCNLSYSYFSRTFKKIMKQSFSEYLNSIRISKAEHLLSATDKTIVEISEELGFSTPSYFIQQFKAKKDISPKKYRTSFVKELKN